MPTCPICGEKRNRRSYLGSGCYGGFQYAYLVCKQCGSLFVDPMPNETVLGQMYGPDYLDAHYAAELSGGVTNCEIDREMNEAVQLLVKYRPGGSVLDVGCGAGRFLAVAHAAGLQPEGYERLAATAVAAERVTGVTVHSGDLADIEASYDAVHLGDVLEHSTRPIEILRSIRRLLAPNGVLLARGPLENHPNLFRHAVCTSRLLMACLKSLPLITLPPYHLLLFTRTGWNTLFRRTGMTIVQELVYEVHWPAPEQFRLRPLSIIKALSMALSASRIGRCLLMGNRVVSVLTINDSSTQGVRVEM